VTTEQFFFLLSFIQCFIITVCHRGYYIELCLGRVFPQSLHSCQQMTLVFYLRKIVYVSCSISMMDVLLHKGELHSIVLRTSTIFGQYCHAPTTAATTTDKSDALRPVADEADPVVEAVAAALLDVPLAVPPAAAGVVVVATAPAPAAPGPPPAPG